MISSKDTKFDETTVTGHSTRPRKPMVIIPVVTQVKRGRITQRALRKVSTRIDQVGYSAELSTRPLVTHFSQTTKNVDWRAHCQPPADYSIDVRAPAPYRDFAEKLSDRSYSTLIAVETAGRKEALNGALIEHNVLPDPVDNWDEFIHSDKTLCIVVAPMDRSVCCRYDRIYTWWRYSKRYVTIFLYVESSNISI